MHATPLPPGTFTVRLELDGHIVYAGAATIEAGERTRVTLERSVDAGQAPSDR
jgi:hypothetical protein